MTSNIGFVQIFVTLLLCLMTALPLNTLPIHNTGVMYARTLFWQMTCAFLVPELILFNSITDFILAFIFRQKLISIGYQDVTLAHGFLVKSGNLCTENPNGEIYSLTSNVLMKLCQNDIGDVLSKMTIFHGPDICTIIPYLSYLWQNKHVITIPDLEYLELHLHVISITTCLLFAHCFSWV